jgi:DNA-binding NarL/FixJ family response regulator
VASGYGEARHCCRSENANTGVGGWGVGLGAGVALGIDSPIPKSHSNMTILIAEDMTFQRDYLRAIVSDHFPDSGPVIEACDGKSAVELALKHRPDLVVLDIKMPGLSGVKAAQQIWAELKLARIIFWSQYKDEIYIRELARIVPGETVYGYVLKSSPDEKLLAALRAVLIDEQCWIDPEIRMVQSRATSRGSGLTDVEYEALIDIALGLTDKAIARRRYLSERGVQNRLRELYAKLSIDLEQIVDQRWGNTYSPRSRAISVALQRGLINADELARENEALKHWLEREDAMPT